MFFLFSTVFVTGCKNLRQKTPHGVPHSVRHIVPSPNALLGRQNEEVVKVFLYFFRQCCAAALTTAEYARAHILLASRACPCCGPAAVRWSRGARNDPTVFYPCACAYGMVETHDFFLTLCSFIGRGTLFRVPGQLLSGGRLDLVGVRGENAGKQNFFCFFAVLRLLWCFF